MTRPSPVSWCFAAALMVLTAASAVHAQDVQVRGRGDAENDRFLRQLVESGDYTLLSSDTLLARNDTITGSALVVGSTMRIEGVITGDLVIVDANVFIRPTARIIGDVRNLGGGLYYSELAAVIGAVHSEPNAPYRVDRAEDGRIVILGTTSESALVLSGFKGLLVPTYDRVDGLTLGAGAGLLLPRLADLEPILRGHAEYRTERSEFTGGAELAFVRRRTELVFGAERTTLTNERWIRSDLVNSISSIVLAKDQRDYYAADRGFVEVRRLLEQGARETRAFVRAQVEDATPLVAGDPWSITGDFRTDNIAVLESRITSAIAGVSTRWQHPRHVFELDASAEFAFTDIFDGNHEFNSYVIDVSWAMAALANHTLTIEPHAQGPLPGTDSLPRQRWSFVGGSGTLYTFDIAQFRGDRVAFVETDYSIPLPARLRIRFLGRPYLELLHAAGMAWTAGESPAFEQNVGLRLRFNMLYLRAVTDPSRFEDDIEFAVGVTFPRRALPWQIGQ